MIGDSCRRFEDERFLRGLGTYLDDLPVPGTLYMQVVRSTHAHARLVDVSTGVARRMAGVRLVATATDLDADRIGRIPLDFPPPGPAGEDAGWPAALQPALAVGIVRYVGEPIAVVIADSVVLARDAAEAIEVEYDPLPAVADTAAATTASTALWDAFRDNVAFRYEIGDANAAAAALERAVHVVRLEIRNQRVIAVPIETRGSIAVPEAATGRLKLYVGTQRPHGVRQPLTEKVMHLPEDGIQVVVRDVGGGFGSKNSLYPEYILCLWAARKLGLPVKWIATRSESLLADLHARDNIYDAELGLDATGRFTGLRVRRTVNLGAYASPRTFVPAWNGVALLAGVYRIPAAHVLVQGVHSNMSPTTVYRGAGRPEAVHACERLIDAAARMLRVDPIELRLRNRALPVGGVISNTLGVEFRDVDPAALLERAAKQLDHAALEDRRRESRKAGRLRGVGVAWFVENLHGPARTQPAWIRAGRGEALFDVVVGTMSNGQGHETTMLQVVAGRLGLGAEALRFVQGDTDAVPAGTGTGASWSATLSGSSLAIAADDAIAQGRALAAELLEAAPDDIEYSGGVFSIIGTERSIAWPRVLQANPGFVAQGHFRDYEEGFPAACHIAEVEVDPETGRVHLTRYRVLQDAGALINPMVAEGQIQGGVAQGIGQALLEAVRYDADSGQLLSGSLMDYALPRADDLPGLECEFLEGFPGANPLGVKGLGEAGTTGAAPATVNAVLDALSVLGVTHIEMPLTPERVWRAIRDAGGAPAAA